MIRLEPQTSTLLGTLDRVKRDLSEAAAMTKYSKPRSSHRRGRRSRRRGWNWDFESNADDFQYDQKSRDRGGRTSGAEGRAGGMFSESPNAYRDVREVAEERAELFLQAGKAGFVTLLLLIFLGPLGIVALFFWAAKYGRRLISVLVEPRLRERLVEEQVGRHIRENVGRERIEIADEHARSLEVLSASIAHEIRNPITAAKSLLQQMRDDPGLADNEEYAQVALAELERVERSISHLLRFGREEELRTSRILMRDVLESALETFRERAERDGVEIRREFDCDGALDGDAEKLRRVVINLVGNAMDALEEGSVPQPRIEISMGENLAGSLVWVRIRDNGSGIDAEAQSKIFTPFYTEKHSGTGLGLAITKKLVEAHRGQIELISEPNAGAEFVVSFPKEARKGSGGFDRVGDEL